MVMGLGFNGWPAPTRSDPLWDPLFLLFISLFFFSCCYAVLLIIYIYIV
jgi:hypothetical protein